MRTDEVYKGGRVQGGGRACARTGNMSWKGRTCACCSACRHTLLGAQCVCACRRMRGARARGAAAATWHRYAQCA
eukprot:7173926-Prymnesium_polylepis.2